MDKLVSLEAEQIKNAYARWAPVYDVLFGVITGAGRRQAVDHINRRRGKVLEVGVGTGITLPRYRRHLKVTGIDLSPDMLARARRRVAGGELTHVEQILEMDAGALTFEDGAFDVVVAMYVMTVVPDPERVMAELERVCAPGGEVILVNHFSEPEGVRGWIEKKLAPLATKLGWRPEFPIEAVMTRDNLRLIERRRLMPFGLFTMLRFARRTEVAGDRVALRETSDVIRGTADFSRPVTSTL